MLIGAWDYFVDKMEKQIWDEYFHGIKTFSVMNKKAKEAFNLQTITLLSVGT